MTRSHSGSSGAVPTLATLPSSLAGESRASGAVSPVIPPATDGGAGGSSAPGITENTDPFVDSVNVTSMSRGPSSDGYVQGYKDVPSLASIRSRVGMTRGLSSSGPSSGAQEIEVVKEEIEVSPSSSASDDAVVGRKQEHPLQHAWYVHPRDGFDTGADGRTRTLYYDSKSYKPDPVMATPKEGEAVLADYELSLLTVGRFETVSIRKCIVKATSDVELQVEGFARHLNNVRLPSQLARNSNYHLFKNGIRPVSGLILFHSVLLTRRSTHRCGRTPRTQR